MSKRLVFAASLLALTTACTEEVGTRIATLAGAGAIPSSR